MSSIKHYMDSPEHLKDRILEENRRLERKLAEAMQSFELLKMVHFDKSIGIDKLNDIIIGCTGCLYSIMFYKDRIVTNLDSESVLYKKLISLKSELTCRTELYVSDDMIDDYTIVIYPVSNTVSCREECNVENIGLLYPTRFITTEVLDFVKSFMLVNDVLMNIVMSREELQRLIKTEPLTKLLNRSSWNSNLERIASEGIPYFVISIDVDNFKIINDTYGHQTGDDILKTTGEWLRSSFREQDFIFRLGGDEFAVTGKLNLDSIDGFFSKLYALNKNYTNMILAKHNIPITISIGTVISDKVHQKDELYLKVDKLLYRSKDKGRNSISIISDFNTEQSVINI